MDVEGILAKKAAEPMAELARQDLERLSVAELHARVAALDAETARTRRQIERAVNHRASAEDLFRK